MDKVFEGSAKKFICTNKTSSASNSQGKAGFKEAGERFVKDIKASTREYKANFIVRKDEDGISCAADLEQEIFADFDISPGDVDICIWLS